MAALSAYRNILRATRIAFHGDPRVLHAARSQARASFNNDRILPADSKEADERITHASEVAMFLRRNVVQGEKAGSGEQEYKIRIHEETERGDNESVKTAGKEGRTDLRGTGREWKKCGE